MNLTTILPSVLTILFVSIQEDGQSKQTHTLSHEQVERIQRHLTYAREAIGQSSVDFTTRVLYAERPGPHPLLKHRFICLHQLRYFATWHRTENVGFGEDINFNEFYFDGSRTVAVWPFHATAYLRSASRGMDRSQIDFFLETTGLWPLMDRTRDGPGIEPFFNHELVGNVQAVREAIEPVDGNVCMRLETESGIVLWLDPLIGFMPRMREMPISVGGRTLRCVCKLRDYREVTAGRLWLPFRLERLLYKPAGPAESQLVSHTESIVEGYQMNVEGFAEKILAYVPPPGYLVHDLDTRMISQVPGGTDHLDRIAEIAMARVTTLHQSGTRVGVTDYSQSDSLIVRCGLAILSIVGLGILVLTLRQRAGTTTAKRSPVAGSPR